MNSAKFKREIYKALSKTCLMVAPINYLGRTYKVPMVHGVGASHQMIDEQDPLAKCLDIFLAEKKGAIIDIGVNIGLYLIKLRARDAQRQYIGFEPNPLCNYYTQELIRLNQFENTSIYPFALSEEQVQCTFYAARKADKMGSLNVFARYGGKRSMDFSFDVMTFVGDDIIMVLAPEKICALKIDVEGAELMVLRGMQKTIAQYRPFIFSEVWKVPDSNHEFYEDICGKRAELFGLLKSLDYVVLDLKGEKEFVEITEEKVFMKATSNDFIFAHKEDRKSFPMNEG